MQEYNGRKCVAVVILARFGNCDISGGLLDGHSLAASCVILRQASVYAYARPVCMPVWCWIYHYVYYEVRLPYGLMADRQLCLFLKSC